MKLAAMLQGFSLTTGTDKRGNFINETPDEAAIPGLVQEGKGVMFLKRTITREQATEKVAWLNTQVTKGRCWELGETQKGGLMFKSTANFNFSLPGEE